MTDNEKVVYLNSVHGAGSCQKDKWKILENWFDRSFTEIPSNTWRALRSDWHIWQTWCDLNGRPTLPANAEDVAEFLCHFGLKREFDPGEPEPGCHRNQDTPRKSLSTIMRYLRTIERLNRACGFPLGLSRQEVIKESLNQIRAVHSEPAKQVWPMQWKTVQRIVGQLGEEIADDSPTRIQSLRDRALVYTGYELLAKPAELCRLVWADVSWQDNGCAKIKMHRSEYYGEDSEFVYTLAPESSHALNSWHACCRSRLVSDSGPIFYSLSSGVRTPGEKGLHPGSVAQILKRLGRLILLPESVVLRIGGNSLRFGGIRDLREEGFNALDIMDAGRYRHTAIPIKHSQEVQISESAIRDLARSQGRE